MIYRYETSNQHFSEAGALKDDGSQYVQGAYSFVGDDGETYWVNYTADEEGFHPIVGTLTISLIWLLIFIWNYGTEFWWIYFQMIRFRTWWNWSWSRCWNRSKRPQIFGRLDKNAWEPWLRKKFHMCEKKSHIKDSIQWVV